MTGHVTANPPSLLGSTEPYGRLIYGEDTTHDTGKGEGSVIGSSSKTLTHIHIFIPAAAAAAELMAGH